MRKFYKYLFAIFIGLGIGLATARGDLDEKIVLGGLLLALVVSEVLGYFGIIKLGPPFFPWEHEKEDE